MSEIRGYKVFNPDWTCRGFQFEVGKVFEEDVIPSCCNMGFHFCLNAADCFNYYDFDPDNKVAEVVALGEVDQEEKDSKCCTNKLEIVREIPWQELLEIVNTGKGCTGRWNSGNWNSGNRNSGNWNSGDWNSGNGNSGNGNSGNRNSGDWNSGNRNSGDWNSGNGNSGNGNSGNGNSGNGNSGDWNSGNGNSGNRNSGNWNSGDWNSGDWNSGNRNSGNGNSGNGNNGNWNSGDWNKCNQSAGVFCTETPRLIMFNKPTYITFEEWRTSSAYRLLNRIDFRPTVWVWSKDMTEEEKAEHPEHETCGGYLKQPDTSECCHDWWIGLDPDEKCIIQNMPGFDPDIFFEITGIRV